MKGTAEASNPVDAWREVAFDDSTWLEGDGAFYYENSSGFTGNTVLNDMFGGYSCIFLRQKFNIANPNDVAQLLLRLRSDDGAIVWINGVEVWRENMPAGAIPYNGTSNGAAGEPNEVFGGQINNPSSFLVAGENVLAIQAFNASLGGSSDFLIDAGLDSVDRDPIPPTLAQIDPTAGSSLNTLVQIGVTFSETVVGVDETDLLINGQPATSVLGGNDTFTFVFPQPPYGPVQVAFATSHGITDQAVPPNSFDETAPGASWTYTLTDNLPPTVVSTRPTRDTVVQSLTSIEIAFSEDVTGVQAGDLLINGTPAGTLNTISSSQYIFEFASPSTGQVSVAWSAGHGIRDTAASPNDFAGGSWTYTLDPNAEVGALFITEFMADNETTLGTPDPNVPEGENPETIFPDWIEIHNSGQLTVNLEGWYLTDDPDELDKWRFPATNILGGAFMVVFASEEDVAIPGAPLHTNFRLSNDGEFLALVKPDGSIASSFSPAAPPQLEDVSYGYPTTSAPSTVLNPGDPARIHIPTDGSLDAEWTQLGFDDSTWMEGVNAVGFEANTATSPNLAGAIQTDIISQMRNVSASAYVRIPFNIPDASAVSIMTLRMRYDDGFAVYLNGGEVARANVPIVTMGGTNVFVQWNNTALSSRADGTVLSTPEEVDISFALTGIRSGENVLAVHGLNTSPSAEDFFVEAEVDIRSSAIDITAPRYFVTPTPGMPNGLGIDELGPVLSELSHEPAVPMEGEDVVVTVRVTPTFSDTISSAQLHYRFMYEAEQVALMNDAGVGVDVRAGDGVYSGRIPGGQAVTGEMIRWYVTVADGLGQTSREPMFLEPLNSRQYEGTIVHVEQTNNLPILHWFIQNPGAANSDPPGANGRSSLFYKGRFYDNLNINLHGQSSRGFPKRSYDIDFHGNEFVWDEDEIEVDDINLLQTYSDKVRMRNVLPYELIADAGAAHHFVVPIRVQQNGTFYAQYDLVENGDDNYLERLGKDPNGALYKMYSTFTSTAHTNVGINVNAEKKTRKFEGSADLGQLYNNLVSSANPDATSRRNWMFDNVNLPATVNFLASMAITSSRDCCHKNYYVYRDTEGTGEWEGMIWDVDLSFGRNWNGTDTYWDNNMFDNNGLNIGGNNGFFREIFNYAPTDQMYLRRFRTIMDELFQSNDVSPSDRYLERRIDELAQLLGPDAKLDLEKWGTWTQSSGAQNFDPNHPDYETLEEAVGRLKQHIINRRELMFNQQAPFTEVPDAQPDDATVAFGTIEFNPSSGNQDEEYIELINTNSYAIDISGWELRGAVEMTFQGGVVIPSGWSLFASPNVRAFRARATSPTGGEQRFVQGAYRGQLSARGEEIVLVDRRGRTNRVVTFAGNPSLAQQYLRITELMYHPAAAPSGSPYRAEDFEYIELKNIGPVSISLVGVKFVNGVAFNFSNSGVTTLAAGETVLIVKNAVAFASRYGAGHNIAGEYGGYLDNGGERIQLLDDDNEEILDFSYNDNWHRNTDGLGFSLVIRDENNNIFSTWDELESWRPSGTYLGTPGADDPEPATVAPILINEALTHTDLPQIDTIELHNPTDNPVNIGGWFLSDDFFDPIKFVIPGGTMIPAQGYLTFDESQYNPTPGVPPSFALSSKGEEVFLFSGDGSALTGYFHGHDFGAAQNGVTFGRHITSTGAEHFVPQAFETLGLANSSPRVGPIVISEIHYHPVDFAGGEDNDLDEFVELHNISGSTVPLYNPAAPADTYQLRDAVDFVFPEGVDMPADSYLLIVGFDPLDTAKLQNFRGKFNVPASVPIYGPWGGKLDNSAEDVELFKPDTPEAGEPPYIRVDKVDYEDDIPWTSAADGIGPSLQRLEDSEYGNDPINWFGAAPTAGRGRFDGVAPVIVSAPQTNLFEVLGNDLTLTVVAEGGEPLQYQWRQNGSILVGATSSMLTLANLAFKDAGIYDVVVFNGAGSAVSQPVNLSVLIPASIISQPRSLTIEQGEQAVFSVSATSDSGNVTYQWRKDGVPIPGETGTSLVLSNVQGSDMGIYDVEVTDPVGSIISDPAQLIVLIAPRLVHPIRPVLYEVVQGQDVTISVEVNADATQPLGYRWRRGFSLLDQFQDGGTTSFVRITNVQPPTIFFNTNITTTVTNLANIAPGLTITNFLVVLPDSDGDLIADAYEIANGMDETNPNDAGVDSDGDGMTNYEESVAGTDPNDAESYLKLEGVEAAGLTVNFQAVAGRSYTVLYKNDPTEAMWKKLADVVAGADPRVVSVPDTSGSPRRIYRLATPQIPD